LAVPQYNQGYEKVQATIRIYDFKNLKQPLLETNLEKAEDIIPKWSPDGNVLLIWTQTIHDDSGKSYYGQHNLYYFQAE